MLSSSLRNKTAVKKARSHSGHSPHKTTVASLISFSPWRRFRLLKFPDSFFLQAFLQLFCKTQTSLLDSHSWVVSAREDRHLMMKMMTIRWDWWCPSLPMTLFPLTSYPWVFTAACNVGSLSKTQWPFVLPDLLFKKPPKETLYSFVSFLAILLVMYIVLHKMPHTCSCLKMPPPMLMRERIFCLIHPLFLILNCSSGSFIEEDSLPHSHDIVNQDPQDSSLEPLFTPRIFLLASQSVLRLSMWDFLSCESSSSLVSHLLY